MALQPKPLTSQAFSAFGQVIQCAGAHHFPINDGTTQRYHDLARLEPGPQGELIVSIFRAQPRTLPMRIEHVERHPLGSQAFMPLNAKAYLVAVAQTLPNGQPGPLQAFVARGDQGVNYARGVWHHPLMALDEVCDFLVIDRKSLGNAHMPNCEEARLDVAYTLSR